MRVSRLFVFTVLCLLAIPESSLAANASFTELCDENATRVTICRSFSAPSTYYGKFKFECSFFDSEAIAETEHNKLVDYWLTAEGSNLVELDFYFGRQGAGIRFRESGTIVGVLIFRIDAFTCVWSSRGGVDPFTFSNFESIYSYTFGSPYSDKELFSVNPMRTLPDVTSVPYEMTMTSEHGLVG